MPSENVHLTDQELLLAIDDELSVRRSAQVRVHLDHCDDCRERIIRIEENIADFARIHRQTFDAKLPPIEGPRAQLRAELSRISDPACSLVETAFPSSTRRREWRPILHGGFRRHRRRQTYL